MCIRDRGKPHPLELLGCGGHGVGLARADAVPEPVSYTHLDVYKRQLVWHEEAGSRWQHLDNIKSLERAAKVKEIYGIVDGESYSRTLSHLNLQLEEAARNQDPAAARIRCEIKSVMYAQAVIDLASARKRIGDEAVLALSLIHI